MVLQVLSQHAVNFPNRFWFFYTSHTYIRLSHHQVQRYRFSVATFKSVCVFYGHSCKKKYVDSTIKMMMLVSRPYTIEPNHDENYIIVN